MVRLNPVKENVSVSIYLKLAFVIRPCPEFGLPGLSNMIANKIKKMSERQVESCN